MPYKIHPVVTEVESLARNKLAENGNVHLADPVRWMSTLDGNEQDGYAIRVTLFSDEAQPLVSLFSLESGFEKLECGDYFMSEIPEAETAISLVSLILDYSLANTPTQVRDLELSSLRHSGECMPWEILSFLYFGDPALDIDAENCSREGGDN
jgi:hypothetical protein